MKPQVNLARRMFPVDYTEVNKVLLAEGKCKNVRPSRFGRSEKPRTFVVRDFKQPDAIPSGTTSLRRLAGVRMRTMEGNTTLGCARTPS